jgi:hypothetical protein
LQCNARMLSCSLLSSFIQKIDIAIHNTEDRTQNTHTQVNFQIHGV